MRFLAALSCLTLCGCSALPWKVASKPVQSQKGGYAYGAGGTIVQPVNSSQPSTQVAEREIWYQEDSPEPEALPVVPVESKTGRKFDNRVEPLKGMIVVPPPRPLRMTEKVTTSLGSHQDLAGIMTAASKLLQGTSMLVWFGIIAVIGGAFGIAWSMHNEHGYMIVCVSTFVIGIIWLIVPASNWWLLLAVIPAGIWLRQQTSFMRLLGFPIP